MQLLLAGALLLLVTLLPLLSEFCKQPLFSSLLLARVVGGRSMRVCLCGPVLCLCWLVDCADMHAHGADRRIFRIFFYFSVKSSVFHHRYIYLRLYLMCCFSSSKDTLPAFAACMK